MLEVWSNAMKTRYEGDMIKVWTCLADDPRNLDIRSNKQRTPVILSQTNKQAYNKYSSNAQVKLK